MAKGGAPTTAAEGLQQIVQSISATMTAPDAGPHIPFLQDMLKAVVGQMQKHNAPKPAGPQPGQAPGGGSPPGGGMPAGGGTNINQMMGQPPSGPSAGSDNGPSGSGVSSDDIRRMVAAQSGTAG